MIRWVLVMVEVEQYMLAGLLGVKAMYQIACDQSAAQTKELSFRVPCLHHSLLKTDVSRSEGVLPNAREYACRRSFRLQTTAIKVGFRTREKSPKVQQQRH